jgi:hypothetical protein
MRILKITIWVILSIILALALFIGGVLLVDQQRTRYLNIDSNDSAFAKSYLIQNAQVIPMTSDTLLRNQSVRVVDGVIVEIGHLIPAKNEHIIDADGAFLMPGLIDMHVHVWDRYELGLYLANGITTVRNVWGHPMHLRIKEAIQKDKILSPDFYTSGPKLTGPAFLGDDNLQLFSPEEAREKVADYHARGYDLIKTYYGLTPELFDAVLDECQKLDMDIVAHPSNEVPYSFHFHPQIKTIEHAEDMVQQPLNYELDTVNLMDVAQLYADHPDHGHCPTLTVYQNIYRMIDEPDILSSEELSYISPIIRMVDSKAQVDRWTQAQAGDPETKQRIHDQHLFHLRAIREIHEAGGTIVCGTDAGIGVTPPGYAIHQELVFYQEAGLSNYEVLKTATINASRMHDWMKDVGSIEPGKKANLLLTSDNPLTDLITLQNPKWVMVKGRIIEQEKLEELVSRAKDRKNLIASLLRYVENMVVEK